MRKYLIKFSYVKSKFLDNFARNFRVSCWSCFLLWRCSARFCPFSPGTYNVQPGLGASLIWTLCIFIQVAKEFLLQKTQTQKTLADPEATSRSQDSEQRAVTDSPAQRNRSGSIAKNSSESTTNPLSLTFSIGRKISNSLMPKTEQKTESEKFDNAVNPEKIQSTENKQDSESPSFFRAAWRKISFANPL